MTTPLVVTAATYVRRDPDLVSLEFNDGSMFSIYTTDASPRVYAHDLLDAWIAEGNTIADPAA